MRPTPQRFAFLTLAAALAALAPAAPPPTLQAPQEGPVLSRAEIIATARRLAEHEWVCAEQNRQAPCVSATPYASDWEAGQRVTGIAYDWGGTDDPETFDRKLREGLAAGSHSRHGSTACTAGIDCSGFVGYCWGVRDPAQKKSTRTLREIGVRPRSNWYTDMKPGDAFNKPGSHVVLFAGHRDDGNPIFYEASGKHNRVIRNDWSTWSYLRGYYPLEYRYLAEE